MAKKLKYILSVSQQFYGQRDAKTYYEVFPQDVWAKMRYLCKEFNAPACFVWLNDAPIPNNTYVGSYSAKYDNFRTPNKQLHKTYNF